MSQYKNLSHIVLLIYFGMQNICISCHNGNKNSLSVQWYFAPTFQTWVTYYLSAQQLQICSFWVDSYILTYIENIKIRSFPHQAYTYLQNDIHRVSYMPYLTCHVELYSRKAYSFEHTELAITFYLVSLVYRKCI